MIAVCAPVRSGPAEGSCAPNPGSGDGHGSRDAHWNGTDGCKQNDTGIIGREKWGVEAKNKIFLILSKFWNFSNKSGKLNEKRYQ
jgi:hypothetical protein